MNFVAFSALWAVIGTAAGGNVPVGSMMFLEFIPMRSVLLQSNGHLITNGNQPSISSHGIDRMVEPRSIDCLLGSMGVTGEFQLSNERDSGNLSPS